jgi:hypothetical protein
MNTKHRSGSFFILVGLAVLLMFIASIMSREVNVLFLFLSLACFFIAFLLLRNRQASDSGRFRVLRQARDRRHQKGQGGSKPARSGGLFGLPRHESRRDRRNREEKSDKNQQS